GFEKAEDRQVEEKRLAPGTRALGNIYLKALPESLTSKHPEAVTRGDIRGVVDAYREKGAPVAGNRAYGVLRRVYSWALGREAVKSSPFVGWLTRDVLVEEKERDRVYTDTEIRSLLETMTGTALEALTLLIFLTAAREEQVRSMRWQDVDLARGVWSAPGFLTKSGKRMDIALSAPAIGILRRRREQNSFGFVFPAETKAGFMSRPTHRRLGVYGAKAGLGEALRFHDIRRSVSDRMQKDLGIPPNVVEFTVLGHTAPKLLRTYMPSTTEARDAYEDWAVELQRILV